MENRIEIDIIITPEGSGKKRIYSISSIQFPNIVTQGESIEQAKARLKEALELYFEEVPAEKRNSHKNQERRKLPFNLKDAFIIL